MTSLPTQLRRRAVRFRSRIASGFWPDTPAYRRLADILDEEAAEARDLRARRVALVQARTKEA